jgi:hypothetical protein
VEEEFRGLLMQLLLNAGGQLFYDIWVLLPREQLERFKGAEEIDADEMILYERRPRSC